MMKDGAIGEHADSGWEGRIASPTDHSLADRFWAKVDRADDDGCWLWTGSLSRGYGQIFVQSKGVPVTAHRVGYDLLVGAVPPGMHLDHLCHNADATCPGGASCIHRRCVNPAHLEPTTQAENIRRGRAGSQRRTHCKHGHEFTSENTRLTSGYQSCRTCDRARCAAYRVKRRVRQNA